MIKLIGLFIGISVPFAFNTGGDSFLPDIRNIDSGTKSRMVSYSDYWIKNSYKDSLQFFETKQKISFRCWEGDCEEYYKLYDKAKTGSIDSIGIRKAKLLLEKRWYELDLTLTGKSKDSPVHVYHFYFDYLGMIHSVWSVDQNTKVEKLVQKMY